MSNNNDKSNKSMFSKENIQEVLQPRPRSIPRLGNNKEPTTSTSEVEAGTLSTHIAWRVNFPRKTVLHERSTLHGITFAQIIKKDKLKKNFD